MRPLAHVSRRGAAPWLAAALLGTQAAGAAPKPAKAPPAPVPFDSGVISGLGARNIGSSAMSGRVSALAARNTEDGKVEVFVGAASGGVWKSMDGGTTFKPVFDQQPVQSIGAIALDPSRPKVVWVGTGEAWTRNSVSIGNGIYRSDDGGESWTHLGLGESERIAQIIVHPKTGDTVFACVPGKLWSDSAERGLYRTTDAGRTWSLVLQGKNLSTGCSSVTLDPGDPRIVLAGLWDFRRQGWTFRSGGDGPRAESGSGLYRSADGGDTWSELDAATARGLPAHPWGRVEVEVAPGDARRVYAFIESESSALYVSDDGGRSFAARDRSQNMVWRPFYFANLVVDPTNPDRVYKTDLGLIVSDDAGRTFSPAGRGHGDWHDIWIDPRNPKHVLGGDDGGFWTSYDGASRWVKCDSLPISQFYHVAIDDRDPYHVYGGLQDNSSWIGPSSFPGGISSAAWENIYGGDGFWVVPDPSDPDLVYTEAQGGNVAVFDRRTRLARDIQPKAGYKEKLRFNWNTPIHPSQNAPGTIYLGAQFLFRTRDRGQSWERISGDLTSNDPDKQKQELSGGITVDNSAAEMHTTIYAIAESPLDGKVIWVGTDDGKIQLTRDGGASWEDVGRHLIEGRDEGRWVTHIEPSRFDAAAAWVTIDRHTYGDMDPHAFRTGDFGRTWTRVAGASQGIRGYAHVLREDPARRDLLYLGSELGLWISIDGGRRWAEFKGGGFPAVAVRDIALQAREGDLVLGTHGRGIWIVDDLSPLRALGDDLLAREAAFLPSRPAQQRIDGVGDFLTGDNHFVGPEVPGGATIAYYQQKRHLFGSLKLEILDPEGKLIDTIPAGKRRGINRVTWSMRLPPPRVPRAAQVAFAAARGPRVAPGTYTVRLSKGGAVYEGKLEIRLDRRASYSLADRRSQLDAALQVSALFARMSGLVDRIQQLRAGLEKARSGLPAGDALAAEAGEVLARADALRKEIVATKEGGAITGEERIREHAVALYDAVVSFEGRPGDYHLARIDALGRELDDVARELAELEAGSLVRLNQGLRSRGAGAVELGPASGTGGI